VQRLRAVGLARCRLARARTQRTRQVASPKGPPPAAAAAEEVDASDVEDGLSPKGFVSHPRQCAPRRFRPVAAVPSVAQRELSQSRFKVSEPRRDLLRRRPLQRKSTRAMSKTGLARKGSSRIRGTLMGRRSSSRASVRTLDSAHPGASAPLPPFPASLKTSSGGGRCRGSRRERCRRRA
jgi:hypothetical protein